MRNVEDKRQKEKMVLRKMIGIYCNGKHKTKKGELCEDCKKINDYAQTRTDKCPFMENKTFCSNCKVHCYNPEMRMKIKEIMRYSGPRMIFYNPILAISHPISMLKEKHNLNRKEHSVIRKDKK